MALNLKVVFQKSLRALCRSLLCLGQLAMFESNWASSSSLEILGFGYISRRATSTYALKFTYLDEGFTMTKVASAQLSNSTKRYFHTAFPFWNLLSIDILELVISLGFCSSRNFMISFSVTWSLKPYLLCTLEAFYSIWFNTHIRFNNFFINQYFQLLGYLER